MYATAQGGFAGTQVEAAQLQGRAMAFQTARGQHGRDVAVKVRGGNGDRDEQQD